MVDDPLGNLLIWGTVVTGKPMGTHPDQARRWSRSSTR